MFYPMTSFGRNCINRKKATAGDIVFRRTKLPANSSEYARMRNHRYRVLMVASHPVQYMSPVFRELAQHPMLDVHVAYCSLQGAERARDPGFGVEVSWDIPLLDGYRWTEVRNRSPQPGLERFWGLLNTGLWSMLRRDTYDAVVVFTGYAYASFWIVMLAAKLAGLPILFGTDATRLGPRSGARWKLSAKRWLLPRIFRLATVVIVPSSAGAEFIRSLGIGNDRVVLTPYTVNNKWWMEQAEKIDRAAVRERWGIPLDAPAVLFCAKMQSWKRPFDLLQAFVRANVPQAYLIYAGDGPLKAELEREVARQGVSARVRFLGFVNQSVLPEVYRSSDLLVLPSEYEPFGVVVNEAMLCGCAVAVSDRVGAGPDLIRPGETGFLFPCGDVDALARILCQALLGPEVLAHVRKAALDRMQSWTIGDNVEAMVEAVSRACSDHASVRARN
jgi:glycosyltransferase involved in cell wall biosynthesis